MIVRLRQDVPHQHRLTAGQLYPVIGIEADSYRIIDDDGKPYLFEPDLFDVVDRNEPQDWVVEVGDDGERYAYPAALSAVGFFEDFHDGKPEAVATFWRTVNRWLADSA
jgi:hypothetical protein